MKKPLIMVLTLVAASWAVAQDPSDDYPLPIEPGETLFIDNAEPDPLWLLTDQMFRGYEAFRREHALLTEEVALLEQRGEILGDLVDARKSQAELWQESTTEYREKYRETLSELETNELSLSRAQNRLRTMVIITGIATAFSATAFAILIAGP